MNVFSKDVSAAARFDGRLQHRESKHLALAGPFGRKQVRAYQLHLIHQKRSWSHINQVACALRFFYGVTLRQTEAFERIVGGQKPDKLPLVLTGEEIARFPCRRFQDCAIEPSWQPPMRRACA